MGAEVVGGGEFEEVGVEGGHCGLDVVEEVGLLHVGALDFYGDLFEHFFNFELILVDTFLDKVRDNLLLALLKSVYGLLAKTIGFKRSKTVVRLLLIINKHY